MICLEILLLKGTLCSVGSHQADRVICHTAGNEFSLWNPTSTARQPNPHTPVLSELRLSQTFWEEHSNTILEKAALLHSENTTGCVSVYKEQEILIKDRNMQQIGTWEHFRNINNNVDFI